MNFAPQYRISSFANTEETRIKLEALLARVAARGGLQDVTSTSKIPNTLVYYKQSHEDHFPV
jgi:hypothetical protein